MTLVRIKKLRNFDRFILQSVGGEGRLANARGKGRRLKRISEFLRGLSYLE